MPEPVLPNEADDTPFWLSPFPFREPDWPPVDEEPE
jgi:hypothetical protein